MLLSNYISATLLALATISQADVLVETPRDVIPQEWQDTNITLNKALEARAVPEITITGDSWPEGAENWCYKLLCAMEAPEVEFYRDSDKSYKRRRFKQRASSDMFKGIQIGKKGLSIYKPDFTSPDDWPPRASIPVRWYNDMMDTNVNPPIPQLPLNVSRRGNVYGVPDDEQSYQGGEFGAALARGNVLPIDWAVGPQRANMFTIRMQPTRPGYWCQALENREFWRCKSPPSNDGPSQHSYERFTAVRKKAFRKLTSWR